MRVCGKKGNFIEAGFVKNPTYKDDIYFIVNGRLTNDLWYLRKDEALMLIMCLSAALNKRITGLDLSKK